MKKGRRKYKDGDKVEVGGYEFIVKTYHYPSKTYGLYRYDGLCISAKEEDFGAICIPPIKLTKE